MASKGNKEVVFQGEPPFRQIMCGMVRRRETPPHDLYTVWLANGPLKQPRYINPKIEDELREFKLEIKQKFETSVMNKGYVFPRVLPDIDQFLDAPN